MPSAVPEGCVPSDNVNFAIVCSENRLSSDFSLAGRASLLAFAMCILARIRLGFQNQKL